MSYQPLFLGLGTAVVRTVAGTNILEGETANLRVGQPVVSRQESTTHVFGGVTANTVYYIKEIVDANNFRISLTDNGDAIVLQDGQGFMLFRAVQREMVGESLRKVDAMLEEIYSGGIVSGGDGGDIDGGSASSIFDPTPGGVVGGILSIIEDETPALGGNLSLNGNNIFGTGDINISGNIAATKMSGQFSGIFAGSLIGPVDNEGVRTGNPTIDGLAFELGNPQAGQVIAWDGPNNKFTLVSVNAISGTDTLDDVLFRGNTSSNSITVGSLTTDSLVLPNGLNYSVIVNPPTIPTDLNQLADVDGLLQNITVDYSNITNTPVLFSGSYTNLTDKPTIPTDVNQLADADGLLQGGGTGLGSRTFASGTTGALAINSVGNIGITGFKSYALLAVSVEIPAWVRVYASAAARTADAARLETEDPLPGSGVIAEVITTTNDETILFTPATIGFNAETPATNTVYLAVKNKGTGVATIEVTLVLLQLEA